MRLVIFYDGVSQGHVDLDDAEPAAGWLAATEAYARNRPLLQDAGDALIRQGFSDQARKSRVVTEAETFCRGLALKTDWGVSVPVVSVEIWDDRVHIQPPFVLVWFGRDPIGVLARLRMPGAGGGCKAGVKRLPSGETGARGV